MFDFLRGKKAGVTRRLWSYTLTFGPSLCAGIKPVTVIAAAHRPNLHKGSEMVRKTDVIRQTDSILKQTVNRAVVSI